MSVVSPHRRAHGGSLRSRLVRVGLAVAVVGLLGSGAAGQPGGPEGVVAPKCSYADTLSRYRRTGDWYRSLLDTRYRLGSTDAPSPLVPVARSGPSGSGSVRRIALADLTAMVRAARGAGAPFAVQSAYRSYSTQVATFRRWVALDGYAAALLGSAPARAPRPPGSDRLGRVTPSTSWGRRWTSRRPAGQTHGTSPTGRSRGLDRG